MHQGLLASPPSHEQIGVWTNARREAALNWTPTAIDLLPNLALELESHPQAVFTNSKVQSGDPDRFVIRPEVFEARPALRIKAIWMGIPSWNRISWHVTIKKQLRHIFRYIFKLPLNHSVAFEETMVYALADRSFTQINRRLAYGSTGILESLEVGESSGTEYKCVCEISRSISQFIWIMMLESINNRREALRSFDCSCLPAPFQTFIFVRWPTLNQFLLPKPQTFSWDWTIGPTIEVTKIGITVNEFFI